MKFELVTSACCLPELTRSELFSAAKTCGYAKTELFATWTKSKFTYTDTLENVNGSGVGVSAVHLPGDVELAKRTISTAAHCGIGQVIVHGSGTPENAGVWLKPLVVHARQCSIELVLTNHKGQSIETSEHIQTALDACEEELPFVLLEAGQFWAAGFDAIAEFKRFEKKVRLIHIKDLDSKNKSVPFGEGRCPLPEFLRVIAESSYRGRIVLEVEMKTTPVLQLFKILEDARLKTLQWIDAK